MAALAASEEGLATVECRLADLIEVPAELDALVERLLGDDLAALVVEGRDDGGAPRRMTAAARMGAHRRATIVSLAGAGAAAMTTRPGEPLLDRVWVRAAARGPLLAPSRRRAPGGQCHPGPERPR